MVRIDNSACLPDCSSSSQTTVLCFLRSYLPGFKHGGPIRSVANMAERLGGSSTWLVVTRDRDAGDDTPYDGVPHGVWCRQGSANVIYLKQDRRFVFKVLSLLRGRLYNVIYLNSFFDPLYTLLPLLVRKTVRLRPAGLVIAPRGEFSPGALTGGRIKKQLYIWLSKALRLHADALFQASSEAEANDIRAALSLPSDRIVIAPDMATDPTGEYSVGSKGVQGKIRVVFLSRIDRMKNLSFALRVLKHVQSEVIFDIFGPRSDESYALECETLLSDLPGNVVATLRGEIPPSKVHSVLAQYDFLFLPSLGENYGHVIQEALVVGTPVLISDRTPWRGLASVHAGFDLSLEDQEGFVRAIEDAAALSTKARAERRKAAGKHGRRAIDDPAIQDANIRLFEMAAKRARSRC